MDDYDHEILEKIAGTVVKRGMSVPAVLFLETMKPLNFIGAQIMNFFGPFLESLVPGEQLYRFTEMMENRNNVELLIQRIEDMEDMKKQAEKDAAEEKRSKKTSNNIFHLWRK